jgi:aspartate beta-hydroxylase
MAFEQLGQTHDAVLAYFNAIHVAQSQGRWLSDASTTPALQAAVKYAMNYVNRGRREIFEKVLEPLRQRFGRDELGRVEQCLAIYLNEQPANLPDPRQAPKFLYFPGLPAQPFFARERFRWQTELEAAGPRIREELQAVINDGEQLEAFLQSRARGKGGLPARFRHDASRLGCIFFFRHGERYAENCARCPQTTALLDAAALVRIRDHAPEALFSVLRPGTHILPHRGVTNTRLVTHLPLIVPSDCALRVGGESHVWQTDRCVTFDDTFEHKAWNRSNETRVVLILEWC